MVNEQAYTELKNIIEDPAWKFLVGRFEYVAYKVDKDFHASKDYKEFMINQGRFNQIMEVVNMLKNPKSLCDDGVQKMGGNTEA
jgi:hypothetical protein